MDIERLGPLCNRLCRVAVVVTLVTACAGSDVGEVSGSDARGGVLTNPAAMGSGEPDLEVEGEGVWLSWTEPSGDDSHAIRRAFYDGEAWSEPQTIVTGDNFFVNWADYPSLLAVGPDTAVAHFLQRGPAGGYDYGVRLSWTTDGGDTWSDPWTPHNDGTPTEHGFVSLFRDGVGVVRAAWLDGRAMVESGPMGLRSRALPLGSMAQTAATEGATLVDDRTCECCNTDATVVGGIPLLAYRDRGDDDLRNIYVARLLEDGWTEGLPVHDDGWIIGGCPVNGPALATREGSVVIAWFTAPEEVGAVNVAFSSDGGVSFAAPIRVDEGLPLGRVDIEFVADGTAVVSWLANSNDGGRILLRRVGSNGELGAVLTVSTASEERSSGFPRIAPLPGGRLLVAWTDPAEDGGVRTTIVPIER